MEEIKVGDYVRHTSVIDTEGTVKHIYTTLVIEDEYGTRFTGTSDGFVKAQKKLSEEDAWIEVALMVGREVQRWGVSWGGYDVPDYLQKSVRRMCYVILGGNGIKVDEEVKVRVRSLIERAKARG